MDYAELLDFIENGMSMTHVYQPIMLETLLNNGGTASAQQVASKFLSSDPAQLDYYVEIVNRWPRKTLKNRGAITESGRGNRNRMFTLNVSGLTSEQRENLVVACRLRPSEYKERKGLLPHYDRYSPRKPISGSKRYTVISKSAGRCVACGVSSRKVPLDVDHIMPKSRGGTDDISNLQALCYECNRQKRDRDDLDFLAEINRKAFGHKKCVMCRHVKMGVENFLAGAAWIRRPYVRPHAVVMPKRHTPSYFDLRPPERAMMHSLLETLVGPVEARQGQPPATIDGWLETLRSHKKEYGPGCKYRIELETGTSEDKSRHCAIHVVPVRAPARKS